MKIESSAFKQGELIPSKYTCDEEDLSPQLVFSDVPAEAKGLVLVMDDPDVPRSVRADGMWDHWLVWNIPPQTRLVEEGNEPQGFVGRNTGGSAGYMGPCPPDREHRYFFKLYALDTLLKLDASMAGKKDLEKAMEGHVLAKAELMGRYRRK